MTLKDVQEFSLQVKPMLAGCDLEVVNVTGNKIQLKLVCPNIGTFKVKGEIIDTDGEIKKNVEKIFAEKFPGAEIAFV